MELDAIGVRDDGLVRIVYRGVEGLEHAASAGAAWVHEIIDPAARGAKVSYHVAMDVDENGAAHVCYAGGGFTLDYATDLSGEWSHEIVSAEAPSEGCSLEIGDDGGVRIAHVSGGGASEARLVTVTPPRGIDADCDGEIEEIPVTGSGVDRFGLLRDLAADEWQSLCEWSIEAQGGPGHETDCGGGVTITVNTVDECVEDSDAFGEDCELFVADFEACSDAMADDPCNGYRSAACAALLGCVM